MPNFEINRPDFVRVDRVSTKSLLYGSLFNNQSNEIHHFASTSPTTKKHSTVWIGEYYGAFYDIMDYPRR